MRSITIFKVLFAIGIALFLLGGCNKQEKEKQIALAKEEADKAAEIKRDKLRKATSVFFELSESDLKELTRIEVLADENIAVSKDLRTGICALFDYRNEDWIKHTIVMGSQNITESSHLKIILPERFEEDKFRVILWKEEIVNYLKLNCVKRDAPK